MALLAALRPRPQVPAPQPTPRKAGQCAADRLQRRAADEEAALERHGPALERLVELGYSPQAAHVALAHLDEWLASLAGRTAMAAAEAAVCAAEPVLRFGDLVRLEGLKTEQNRHVNRRLGFLRAWRADNQRWKVVLKDDGQVFYIKAKNLQPLRPHKICLPEVGEDSEAAAGEPSDVTAEARALASAWDALEARRAAWQEAQETREIEALERQELLLRAQELLQWELERAWRQRRALALERARDLALLEQQDRRPAGAPRSFHIGSEPCGEEGQEAEGGPGMYRVLDETLVGDGPNLDSSDIGAVQEGDVVEVLEVLEVTEDERVRARIRFEDHESGSAWMSLWSTDGGIVWAEKIDPEVPDDVWESDWVSLSTPTAQSRTTALFAVGTPVQYFSASKGHWVQGTVQQVSCIGEVRVSCKPKSWIPLEKQYTMLRLTPCVQAS